MEHVGELGHVGLQPVLLLIGLRGLPQRPDHFVDVALELIHFAGSFHGNAAGEVALGDRGGNLRDRAHLGGQIGGHFVDVVRQVHPRSGGSGHVRLAPKYAFDPHLSGDPRDLVRGGGQGVGHPVDRLGQRSDLSPSLGGYFLLQVPFGHGGHDRRNAAHLVGQVAGHQVDAFSEITPGARDPRNFRLPAQLTLRADLPRDARHF